MHPALTNRAVEDHHCGRVAPEWLVGESIDLNELGWHAVGLDQAGWTEAARLPISTAAPSVVAGLGVCQEDAPGLLVAEIRQFIQANP